MGFIGLGNLSRAWLSDSKTVHTLTKNAARIRAAESARPLALSNNISPAFILDEYGTVLTETTPGKEELVTARVTPQNIPTLYTYLSALIPILCLIISALGLRPQKAHFKSTQKGTFEVV